jgi:hypothetical protein
MLNEKTISVAMKKLPSILKWKRPAFSLTTSKNVGYGMNFLLYFYYQKEPVHPLTDTNLNKLVTN